MKKHLFFIAAAVVGLMNQFSAQTTFTINTYAGAGAGTSTGDGGAPTAATFNAPHGVVVDAGGNVFISEFYGAKIRKVNTSNIVSTYAGTGVPGFGGDGGPATAAQMNDPVAMCVDAAGNLYVAEFQGHRIRKITPTGTITTVAGNGILGFSGDGGLATSAQLNSPTDVKVDALGNIYIADYQNNRIRMVTPSGTITTIAGNGTSTSSGDGGLATAAGFNSCVGVYLDPSGNIYVSELTGYKIRKINTSGIVSTFAGTGAPGSSGDGGLATAATLNQPGTVVMDAGGNILICEYTGNRIRSVSPGGIINTVAGTGTGGFSGDGGIATSAQISGPFQISKGLANEIYFGDYVNNRVRVLTSTSCTTAVTSTVTATNVNCFGNSNGSATVTANGGGPFTYTWMPTAQTTSVASGLSAGNYTVIVKNSCGNTSTQTINISQPPMLITTALSNPSSICSGMSSTLTGIASGGTPAYSYTWMPGGATGTTTIVSPTTTTVYTFTTKDANLCSSIYTVVVFVNTPTVTAASTTSLLCIGQSATLTANGANTYTWSTTSTNTTIVISPTVTTSYTVAGTNGSGCMGATVFTQSVSTCVGLNELIFKTELSIYPNPTKGEFLIINAGANTHYEIYNGLGQLIQKNDLNANETKIILNEKPGIYFVKILEGTTLVKVQKVVKE